MTITAGVLSQNSVGSTTAQLSATAATAGTGPYTYQWYKSTASGFSPGGGNIIAGATALTLSDSGLTPNTIWYYKVVATDTGHSNDTVTYTQLAVTTTPASMSPNSFSQSPTLGQIDLPYNYNTVAVQIDASQATALYAGSAVKIVDSAGGVPKVVAISAEADEVFGYINFDIKNVAFLAGDAAEVSQGGNVMWLYAGGAIARGVQVTPVLLQPGTVQSAAGNTGDDIVGWAFDKAVAAGDLIRIKLLCPSFRVV